MNILCDREKLLQAVSLLSHIVPNKTQVRPILANIKFSILDDEHLELTSTDMEMGMRYIMPIEACYEKGEILLPALQLQGILREAGDDKIKLENSDRTAIFSGKGFQYKLPSFSEEEFPEVPELQGDTINIKKVALLKVINEVSFAMNKDKNRYSLNSLFICLNKDKLEGVATDQIRLAFSTQAIDEAVADEEKYIFPAKSLPVISSVFNDDNEEHVTLVKGKNQVTLKFKNGFFITRLVDANMPPYRDAYAKYSDVQDIILDTDVFSKAIRQVILLTCENARNIALILEKDNMVFKASTPLGEGKVEVPITYDDEDMTVGMNPYFVQDFLKEVSSQGLDKVRLKVAGPKKPIILSSHDDYLYFMSPTAL